MMLASSGPILGSANLKGSPETQVTSVLLTVLHIPSVPSLRGITQESRALALRHRHLCLDAAGTHTVIITIKTTTATVCGGFDHLQTLHIPCTLSLTANWIKASMDSSAPPALRFTDEGMGLQMIKWLAQEHNAGKKFSQDSNPALACFKALTVSISSP